MHPRHGFHVVSYGDDVAAMRRAGWVEDDGKALAEKLAPAPPAPAEAPQPAPPRAPKRKK
jgi:hypothetical protein